jgi:hypothetical protein
MTLCALDAKEATNAGFALVADGSLEDVRTADTAGVCGSAGLTPGKP